MGPSRTRLLVRLLCLVWLGVAVGCAEGPRAAPMPRVGTPAFAVGAASAAPTFVAVSGSDVGDGRAQPVSASDEPFDPFATEQENVEEYDPWEPFNAAMFEVNRKIDKYALKPIAKAYNWVLPTAAQRGVENFFHNIRSGPRLLNNLLQGKVNGAGTELGRFLLNTTFGLGGFFDVAKHMDIRTPDEDFGQTLGVYGVPPGPYLVLPLFPPFTLRDVTGYVVDLALDPINWLVFPILEVDGIPSAVSHSNRTTTTIVQLAGRSAFIINERSLNLESYQGVEEATVDLYSAVRNAYLQKRAKAIKE